MVINYDLKNQPIKHTVQYVLTFIKIMITYMVFMEKQIYIF